MLHWIAIILGIIFTLFQLFYAFIIIFSLIENTGYKILSVVFGICHAISPVLFVFFGYQCLLRKIAQYGALKAGIGITVCLVIYFLVVSIWIPFVELDKLRVEVHIMIFQMASTSAYDKNEIQVYIIAEKGETIRIGDIITIPMNDHTFEQREITAMYRDRKKWKKGKCLFSEIKEGEWAECIIHNIHSGMIHTISSPYDEDLLKDGWVCG